MSRNLRLYLEDITESCDKILSYTSGMSFEAFIADDRTYDAVLLNLQIIGESVKNLPQDVRDRAPDVEWRKIAGLRDIIAHAYFQVEGSIIWDIGLCVGWLELLGSPKAIVLGSVIVLD
jgi:uncharacterized protein with HEPN domain